MGMPLCYTHTCDSCGSTMTVYDRSYWQTVECTACGKTFIGNPPIGDDL